MRPKGLPTRELLEKDLEERDEQRCEGLTKIGRECSYDAILFGLCVRHIQNRDEIS